MPIARINPDGSVKIYNSNTGEIKDVAPEELAQYNPKLIGQYQEMAQAQAEEQAQGRLVEQGVGDLSALVESNPILAEQLVKKGVKSGTTKELTEGERTKNQLAKTGLKSIGSVSEIYEKDPGILSKQLLPGKFASRSFDSALFSTVDTLLRIRTGATAPEEEIRRYMDAYGPQFGDKPEDVKFKLNNLETALREEGNISDEEYGKIRGKKKEPAAITAPTAQYDSQPTRPPVNQGALNSVPFNLLGDLGGAEVGLAKGITDFLIPRTKKALTEGPQELATRAAERSAGRVPAKGNFMESLVQSLGAGKDLAEVAGPAGVETGLMAAPLTKLGLLKGGALSGGITGATTPEDISPLERLQKTGTGALGGALTGGVLKGFGGAGKALEGSSKRLITQVFRPNASELRDFKRFSGGLDFTDEVTKRDLPFIKGKNGQQILEYYTSKVDELNGSADDFLSKAGKSIDKKELLGKVDELITGREGRVLQDSANSSLAKLREDIVNLPDKIDLVRVNQIKRDLQTAGKAAYGPSGNPSPVSDAFSSMARNVNNLLETKAPGVKDINKSSQFYHLAKDSVERKVNQASGSEGGLVSQMLGGGAMAGVGASAITMNPMFALAGVAPAVANAVYRSPKFKTKAASTVSKAGQAQMPDLLKKLLLIGGGRAGSSL